VEFALEVTFVFSEAAEHVGDIACDAWLFGDDERFTQRFLSSVDEEAPGESGLILSPVTRA
jgi:hypothetical protein